MIQRVSRFSYLFMVDKMQKSPILQNPIYPRNITELTDFTDFTDLQLTDLWPTGESYNNSYDFFSGCRVAAALDHRSCA